MFFVVFFSKVKHSTSVVLNCKQMTLMNILF